MQFFREWVITNYLIEHFSDKVGPRLAEHAILSATTLLIALAISLPLGLLLNRKKQLAGPVITVLNIIYTIPSLALFAVLVSLPFMDFGPKTAITALTAYSLFSLVRNTMVGFDSVDPTIKEAARGMGMSARQLLWRVEFPLALPVIVAGLRIATLSTIGLATIASWVGAGGLGQLLRDAINSNIHLFNIQSQLYAGLICVALMAVGSDLLFRLIERSVGVPLRARSLSAPRAVVQAKEA